MQFYLIVFLILKSIVRLYIYFLSLYHDVAFILNYLSHKINDVNLIIQHIL